jgi:hypothetical protein
MRLLLELMKRCRPGDSAPPAETAAVAAAFHPAELSLSLGTADARRTILLKSLEAAALATEASVHT